MISSAVLQLLAIISMIIDHVGYYFFPSVDIFRIIGRLAFPLFAFGIAEGLIHTHSRKKYLLRLATVGVISQFIIVLLNIAFNDNARLNIFFTLITGFISVIIIEKKPILWPIVLFLAALAEVLGFDYGAVGVGLILAFYFIQKHLEANKPIRLIFLAISVILAAITLATFQPWRINYYAILAIIPILLYSGKKGKRLPAYLNYAVYPAHLLIILAIQLIISLPK
jgi:hypothetical protein